jgi:dihydrolipoamide dehydrogenase
MMNSNSTQTDIVHAEVLVLGGGPGGYTAAFRAADLGKQVVLVERYPVIGGVCLNVGCIPSKALLHMAQVIHEADEFAERGIVFEKPALDIDKIRDWKQNVTNTLNAGLAGLVKQRKITLIHGLGQFTSANTLDVQTETGVKTIRFEQAIIAAGSQPTKIPVFPNDDPRLMDSTGALALKDIPKNLLIVGGGIIGLEMATVYHAFGSKISVVELMEQIIPGCDKDLITPLFRRIKKQYDNIWLETKVASIEAQVDGLKVSFEGKNAPEPQVFDGVLVAVGRRPNGNLIGAEHAGITVNQQGFIPVDKQQRTNIPHIFAVGDIVGNPMLAHKAVHEGKVAAEVTAGHKAGFDALTIPSVAYTDPEVAWMGLTENQAKEQGIEYDKAVFPWAASGRSLSIGRKEGLTKLLCDKQTGRILGAGIVGTNAGELIAEAVLALEMGADADDISLTIHPHPTLSETLGFAAEIINGTITDIYIKKDKS